MVHNEGGNGEAQHLRVPALRKQIGDACEMLVAAELTLAGVPAMKAPDYWPGYDVVAQPVGQAPVRISVKARTSHPGSRNVSYRETDVFDWMAIVILPASSDERRAIYIVPRQEIEAAARVWGQPGREGARFLTLSSIPRVFSPYRDRFDLSRLS